MITTFQMTGILEWPDSNMVVEDWMARIELYNISPRIVNLKINDGNQLSFYSTLDALKSNAREHISQIVDSESDPVLKLRIYQTALEKIRATMTHVNRKKTQRFLISNEEHYKSIPEVVYPLKLEIYNQIKKYLTSLLIDLYKPLIKEYKVFYLSTVATQGSIASQSRSKSQSTKSPHSPPISFDALFKDPSHAQLCLDILKKLDPAVLSEDNRYIGKNKGVFPLWLNILYDSGLISHQTDKVYKDLLNSKIESLNLSKDASEFRKNYSRVGKYKFDVQIKALLSQSSLLGKVRK